MTISVETRLLITNPQIHRSLNIGVSNRTEVFSDGKRNLYDVGCIRDRAARPDPDAIRIIHATKPARDAEGNLICLGPTVVGGDVRPRRDGQRRGVLGATPPVTLIIGEKEELGAVGIEPPLPPLLPQLQCDRVCEVRAPGFTPIVRTGRRLLKPRGQEVQGGELGDQPQSDVHPGVNVSSGIVPPFTRIRSARSPKDVRGTGPIKSSSQLSYR